MKRSMAKKLIGSLIVLSILFTGFLNSSILAASASVDKKPPVVSTATPAKNAVSVPVDTKIVISFSEAIKADTRFSSITLVDPSGSKVAFNASITGTKLVLAAKNKLKNGVKYTLKIPAKAVKDKANNSFKYAFAESFTTALSSGSKSSQTAAHAAPSTPTTAPAAAPGTPATDPAAPATDPAAAPGTSASAPAAAPAAPATDPATIPLINMDKTGMQLHLETDHFLFYSELTDASSLNELAVTLEDNFNRVTTDLNKVPADKTTVRIYSSVSVYHNAIGHPELPDWSVGNGGGGIISMTTHKNPGPAHTSQDIIQIAVHEFTHTIELQINPNVTRYKFLNEGIATYEAGQTAGVTNTVKRGAIPDIKNLWNTWDAAYGYQYGYAFAQYVADKFGYGKLIDLIKTGDLTGVLGMDYDKIQAGWVSYLHTAYNF